MATQLQLEISNAADLQRLVNNSTWKELLTNMVETKKLDPWNIDISAIVKGYIEVIKAMKVLELRIPANIILAASVLLRFKSNFLIEREEVEPSEPEPLMQRREIEVPELIAKARIQPPRRITLQELIEALDGAMKIEENRKVYAPKMIEKITLAENVDEKINFTYKRILEAADKLGYATFEAVAEIYPNAYEKLTNAFIPMLFLAQKDKISLMQEEFFGSIIINVKDKNGN